MKLYHGTIKSANKVTSILKSGLKESIRGRRGRGIYLSDTIEGAKSWAEHQRTFGGVIVVLIVNIPERFEYRLIKDYALNQLAKRVWIGDWVYRGKRIPASWIRLIWEE